MSCYEVSGSTLLLMLYLYDFSAYYKLCMSFTILAKPLTILEFQTKLFAQSEHLPMK